MSNKTENHYLKFLKENIGSCLSWAITFAWLIFIYFKIKNGTVPASLNEFGDFIAGSFAPLAFFWLVRGYYQQSRGLEQNSKALRMQAEELQKSTEALNLQVQEMRQSVDQQQKMVEIYNQELSEKHFQVEPFFNIQCKNFREYNTQIPIYDDDNGELLDTYDEAAIDFYLEFENRGEIARNVKVSDKEEGYIRYNKYELNRMEKGKVTFSIDGMECEYFYTGHNVLRKVILSYQNIYGKEYTIKIICKLLSHEDFETGERCISCQAKVVN